MADRDEILDRRLAEAERAAQRAEGEVAAIRSEMAHLTQTVDGIARTVQSFSSEMRSAIADIGAEFRNRIESNSKDLYERIEQRTASLATKIQFPWQQVFAGLAILVVISGGILKFTLDIYSRDIANNREALYKLTEHVIQARIDAALLKERDQLTEHRLNKIEALLETFTPRVYGSSDGTDRRLTYLEDLTKDWRARTQPN